MLPQQASTTVLGTLGLALLAVLVPALWQVFQYIETLVHESGHTVVALLTGHWVDHVVIHRCGGGGTKPARAGGVVTSALIGMAGYSASAAAGLLLAYSVVRQWDPTTVLLVALALLVIVVLLHETWLTLFVVLAVGLPLLLVVRTASHRVQEGVIVFLAFFLVLAGLRTALLLAGLGRDPDLDTYKLERFTLIPDIFWKALFILFAAFAAWQVAHWLLPLKL